MPDKETILIGCRMPSGISLHVMKRLDRDPSMLEMTVPVEDMGYINLPGFAAPRTESFTTIDKAMWDAWWADNKTGGLATSGAVFPPDDPEAAPTVEDKVKADAPEAKPAVAPAAPAAKVAPLAVPPAPTK